MILFTEVKINPKIHMETQKKETAGGIKIPKFKIRHGAIVTKPACYWDKN